MDGAGATTVVTSIFDYAADNSYLAFIIASEGSAAWYLSPHQANSPVTFFKTSPALARALAERNYNDATPVQSAVLAKEAEARDILVSAQTGSGKTVAYGLAIASTILGKAEKMGEIATPVALIIAPTRELALQVERELGWLYHYAAARIVSCVGGMDSRVERRKLSDGAHIVVGTPGRLRDHIERGGLNIAGLVAIVLDEADEMLDLGFREDLEFILQATPTGRRTLMFSATMPKGIGALAKRYQRDALRIEVAGGERGHADIEYRAIRVAPKETEHVVVNLLQFVEAQTAIVFCNTREAVRHLHATLLERGFSAVLLSGELSQHERNQSMQALRDGRARVCVATDVAARGIDLPNLGLVVHAELPHDAEALQHRSGRTGRAGRKGVSALLVPVSRRRRAEQLLTDAGVRVFWSGPPSAEEIRKLDQARLLQDPDSNGAPYRRRFRDGETVACRANARTTRRSVDPGLPITPSGTGGRHRSWKRSGASRNAWIAELAVQGPKSSTGGHFGWRSVVPAQYRPDKERRSEMAIADALPQGKYHETRHRRHPYLRA